MSRASGDKLRGKVAIVTGGAAGIGRAIAMRFAQEGARVMIGDIDRSAGEAFSDDARKVGLDIEFVSANLRVRAEAKALVAGAIERFNGLDILVNNAGVGVDAGVDDTDDEDWDRIFETNVRGAFFMTQLAVPHMRAAGGGSIVNIGSLFATRAWPIYSAYAASKGAIRQFTKTTALSYGGDGIRVNAVHPGFILTPGARADAAKMPVELMGPLKRWGDPEDIAAACLFLASDDAKFIVGCDLCVDGGVSI